MNIDLISEHKEEASPHRNDRKKLHTIITSHRSNQPHKSTVPSKPHEQSKLLKRKDLLQDDESKSKTHSNSSALVKNHDTSAPPVEKPVSNRLTCIESYFKKFNQNVFVNQAMAVAIMLSIFGDDFRRVVIPKSFDVYIDWFMIVLMLLFTLEIVFSLISMRRAYLQSYTFLFDVLATLTMLLDTTMVSEDVIQRYSESESGGDSKASQLGNRVGKMLKMIRLVRLLRLSKALNKSEAALIEEITDQTMNHINEIESQISGKPSLSIGHNQKQSKVHPTRSGQSSQTPQPQAVDSSLS